jgi:hypothetical protein
VTFTTWLSDHNARRCILVEAVAQIAGIETTLYLSSKGYVTGNADTPPNTVYEPAISGGVNVTESLSLTTGRAGLTYGDIELYNVAGERDNWLDYIWTNRAIKVYLGDLSWQRSDYQIIFDGIIDNIDSRARDRLNIKIRDKLERLNTPLSDVKLGGTTPNKESLIPLTFGEVSNIAPLLSNPATHEYQVHNVAIELIIEVRDNGVPVFITPSLSVGKFFLLASPAGTITASIQGDKPSIYENTISKLIQRIVTGFGKASTRFTSGDLDASNLATFDTAHAQPVGVFVDARENVINVIQDLAASVGAQVCMSRAGLLRLLEIKLPPDGIPWVITSSDMVAASLHIVDRITVKSSVKIGYCRNWYQQPDLQTGIVEESKKLLAEDYMTVTSTDIAVAATYKLDSEPDQRNTLLISTIDAQAEADRELNIYKVPRVVFGFEGFPNLLELELGQAVTLQHSRFGLSAGKTGVVTKLSPDWSNFRVKVEVLI